MIEKTGARLYEKDGRDMARAVAAEAKLRCTDPVYGQMETRVVFKDETRRPVLFESYIVALEALAGMTRNDRERYFQASDGNWGNQDLWERAFFDELDAQGALIDLTEGPY
ncbi:MAG: hypothetical protein U0520_01485 [Candidatus Saccharimonadales bacterium]